MIFMKKIALYIILAFLILLVALFIYSRFDHNNKNELVLYGNVDIRQVDLGFRVNGRVKELLVDEGDTVTPGMLLASLDPIPFLDALAQAKGEAASAKAAYENARILLKRREALLPSKSVSQEDYDDALSNRNVTKASYEAAMGALATAQTNLKDSKMYSPTDGWVLTRIREPGSIANLGEAVLTVSIKSPLWIRAYVNEPNLGRIHFGMKGKVFTDTPGGKVYHGHIGFISPVSEFTPKTVETTELRTDLVYRLRLIVDDPDEGLRQGMPVTVKFDTHDQN